MQSKKILVKCKKCGKEFLTYPYNVNSRKYCSKECWKTRGEKVEVQCKECGKIFLTYVSVMRQYCSLRCKQKGCGKKLKGRIYNPNSRQENIARTIKWNKDHPKRRREIANNYSRKHMDRIIAWNRNHPKERNITIQKGQKKMRQKVINLLGCRCALCGRECQEGDARGPFGLQFHEKNHKRHPSCDWWYILKHITDFIPLCHRCHIIVTQMHVVFGVTFDELKAWLDSRKIEILGIEVER